MPVNTNHGEAFTLTPPENPINTIDCIECGTENQESQSTPGICLDCEDDGIRICNSCGMPFDKMESNDPDSEHCTECYGR